jgi:hypothetical protein
MASKAGYFNNGSCFLIYQIGALLFTEMVHSQLPILVHCYLPITIPQSSVPILSLNKALKLSQALYDANHPSDALLLIQNRMVNVL